MFRGIILIAPDKASTCARYYKLHQLCVYPSVYACGQKLIVVAIDTVEFAVTNSPSETL